MEHTQNERLGQTLMHVCRARNKAAHHFMERGKMYRGQGMMLMFISDHEGMAHSEVAERLNISPAATTKVIKRLEKEGYLQRRSDEHDERISRVFLMPKGKSIIEGIRESFRRLDDRTFQGFSDADQEKFRDYLDRILANLREDKS